MQQRLHLASAPDFKEAHRLKLGFLDLDPKVNVQIRRRKNKFEVVRRVSVNKVPAVPKKEVPEGAYTKRKRSVKGQITFNNPEKKKNHTGKWSYLGPVKPGFDDPINESKG